MTIRVHFENVYLDKRQMTKLIYMQPMHMVVRLCWF